MRGGPRAQFEMPPHDGVEEADESDKAEISMMATLKASWPPSMVPRRDGGDEVFVLMLFVAVACGRCRRSPAVSVSGTSILATRMVPGAVMMTAESRSLRVDAEAGCRPP